MYYILYKDNTLKTYSENNKNASVIRYLPVICIEKHLVLSILLIKFKRN